MSASVEDTYYALQRIIEAQSNTRNNLNDQFENISRDRNEKYIVVAGMLAPLLPDLKPETLRDAQAMVFTPTTGRNGAASLEDYVTTARAGSDNARARRAEILQDTGTKNGAEIEALIGPAAKAATEAAAALRAAKQARNEAEEPLSGLAFHNRYNAAIKINQENLPAIQNYGWMEWLGSRDKREAYSKAKSIPNLAAKFERLAQATGTHDEAQAADTAASTRHDGLKASLREFRRTGEKIREEGAILADARLYFAQLVLRRPDNVEHVAEALPPEQAKLFRMGALQAVSLGGLADQIETQFGQTQLSINDTKQKQGKLEKAMKSSKGRRHMLSGIDLSQLDRAAAQIDSQIEETNRRIRSQQTTSSSYQDNTAANFLTMMASYALFAAAMGDSSGAHAAPNCDTGASGSFTGHDAGASLATGFDVAAAMPGLDAGAFTVPSLDIALPNIGNIEVSIPSNAFDGVSNIGGGNDGGVVSGGFSGGFDGGGGGGVMAPPVYAPQMK